MSHHSTGLDESRVKHWRGLTAPLALVIACTLLVVLPTTAFASAPEVRGEWELVLKSAGQTLTGKTLIANEANNQGEFAAKPFNFENGIPGTFSGKLEGANASVKITTAAAGPVPAGEFVSNGEMKVESGVGTLALSGNGTFSLGADKAPGTLVATRLKTQKQIEEQEAREKLEREEREAQANVRGEWELTLEDGPDKLKGIALVGAEANSKNEFAAEDTIFENVIPGSFSGTLEGTNAIVKVTTQAAGPVAAAEFTSATIAVASNTNPTSMTGTGNLSFGGGPPSSATLKATKIKTYQEVKAREEKEHEAIEQQEREAREAKEKVEREAKEKIEREARERTERETREKTEREAKEKSEREAREAIAKNSITKVTIPPLLSVGVSGKSLTVSASGVASLQIANPNPYAISGRVTLQIAPAGKTSGLASRASKTGGSLGTASFGISPQGEELVKVKLSQQGREELTHHKSLRVLATIATHAANQTTATKTFALTLHAAKTAHPKR